MRLHCWSIEPEFRSGEGSYCGWLGLPAPATLDCFGVWLACRAAQKTSPRLALWMLAWLVGLSCGAASVSGADWVRAGINTNQPVWGLRDGLQFAVPPGGFRGGGPRGLIRLGYPVLTNGGCDLINFIAIEPVVKGRKGFSELERSRLDGRRGKLIWAEGPVAPGNSGTNLVAGTLSTPASGVEQLEVALRVEKFDNGAHVRLVVSQRSDAPDEIQFAIHAEPDSARMDYCILTATMGNMARTRLLWLRNETVSSLKLYSGYRDRAFAAHSFYPLERLVTRRFVGVGQESRPQIMRWDPVRAVFLS